MPLVSDSDTLTDAVHVATYPDHLVAGDLDAKQQPLFAMPGSLILLSPLHTDLSLRLRKGYIDPQADVGLALFGSPALASDSESSSPPSSSSCSPDLSPVSESDDTMLPVMPPTKPNRRTKTQAFLYVDWVLQITLTFYALLATHISDALTRFLEVIIEHEADAPKRVRKNKTKRSRKASICRFCALEATADGATQLKVVTPSWRDTDPLEIEWREFVKVFSAKTGRTDLPMELPYERMFQRGIGVEGDDGFDAMMWDFDPFAFE